MSGDRSIGLNHGAGKGDKDRTTDRKAFLANLDEVKFTGVVGGTKSATGFRKVYGVSERGLALPEDETAPSRASAAY